MKHLLTFAAILGLSVLFVGCGEAPKKAATPPVSTGTPAPAAGDATATPDAGGEKKADEAAPATEKKTEEPEAKKEETKEETKKPE